MALWGCRRGRTRWERVSVTNAGSGWGLRCRTGGRCPRACPAVAAGTQHRRSRSVEPGNSTAASARRTQRVARSVSAPLGGGPGATAEESVGSAAVGGRRSVLDGRGDHRDGRDPHGGVAQCGPDADPGATVGGHGRGAWSNRWIPRSPVASWQHGRRGRLWRRDDLHAVCLRHSKLPVWVVLMTLLSR